jgi:multidrug efflux pump
MSDEDTPNPAPGPDTQGVLPEYGISRIFILRPVATTLLTIGIALAGMFAFFQLPVAPLPQVDFPTISVNAQLPGASPDTVASSLASPLERHLGEIADVTEMTSTSSVGQTRITLQFGLDRDIDGAARDVEAAINAARADLPTNLVSNPTYRKVNPADAPVLILALTSKTLTRGQMYDAASNVLQQAISQLSGVGQVVIGGAAQPAVRVELNIEAAFKYGIGLEDIRAALSAANANSPKGFVDAGDKRYQIYTNDQSTHAADYQPLIVAYRNNAPIRLSDLGDIEDSVSDLRNEGLANGKPAVLVIIFRQPGANILTTVQGVKAALPHLKAAMPADIDVTFASDRTTTIQASLNDTERTLVIAVVLVTAVVYLFLRNWRFVIIPAVAVPVSVIGTFGAMYLMGFSLDNLSLMALTIATGFVVDDAIVVLENIARHIEDGMDRREAALTGAREISYTIITITISLIAVFLPILLMGGIIGRLFQEFALTLSLAILISMVISLTTTPMMCALLLRPTPKADASAPEKKTWSDRLRDFYGRTLGWALEHSLIVAMMLVATVGLTVFLYIVIPKGFFPQEDTGRLTGAIQADQSISFQAMSKKLAQTMSIVDHDPAVENVVGFTGSGSGGGGNAQTNTGSVYISLKDESKRDGLNAVLGRLRKKLAVVTGSRLYLQPVQDIRVGGRQSNATYQYTLQGDTTAEVYGWAPKLLAELQKEPILTDVNSDQQQGGLETDITIDRKTAARLGLNMSQIDNLLYDAFGQRQVATLYEAQNQYHVVMEAAPRYWQDPSTLSMIYISTSGGSASGTQTTALSPGTISASAATTGGGGAAGPGAVSLNACGAGSASTTGIGASTYQTASTSALASLSSNSPTATTAVLTNASHTISINPALPTATLASQTVGNAGASCVDLNSGGLNAGGGSASSGTSTGSSPSTSTPSARPTANAGSTSSGSGNAEAGSSAVNASENSLASTGHGSASSGSAVSTGSETMVPLSAIAKVAAGNTPLAVNHQSQYVSATISFNLAAGKSLSDAVSAITAAKQRIGMPDAVKGIFAGTAQAFQQSLDTEPMLVGAALIAVYIVLGILYESYIHPITILSTLPSAGLGALLALLLFHLEFTIISLIGVILLIGIVKKNAILMIDFAIHAQREQNITARDAIHQAALLRMRPILMTTLAAMFGAVPLAIAFGVGSELRQPLGISIVGGLAVSQILTLYTTPVIYLYLDRLRAWLSGEKR